MGSSSSCTDETCSKDSELFCGKCRKKLCYACSTFHLLTFKGHFLSFLSIPDPVLSDLVLIKLLYSTSNLRTHLFIASKAKKLLAVKVQDCTTLEELNKRQEEASLLRSLRHPSICECYKSLILSSKSVFRLLIFMEFCKSDMEHEIIKRRAKNTPFTESELRKIIQDLIEALAYLQGFNVAHRDLKPANLLMSEKNVKIADFGLSLQSIDLMKTSEYYCAGTLSYLSPVLKNNFIQSVKTSFAKQAVCNPFKSDVYSLGLTVLHMATLEIPDLNDGQDLESRVEEAVERLEYSFEIQDLVRQMLVVNEKNRMDFLELLNYAKSFEIHQNQTSNHSKSLKKINLVKSKIEEQMMSRTFSEKIIQYTTNASLPCQTEPSPNEPIKPRSNSYKTEIIPETRGKSINFSSYSPLIPFKCKLISEYLKETSNFEELDLAGCYIDHVGLGYILEACNMNLSLHLLNLGQNNLGSEGGRILGKALSGLVNLQVLKLFACHLTDEGIMWIGKGLAGLKEVYLADNEITNAGCCFISKNLGKIEILSITHNSIGDDGAVELAAGLSMSGVRFLYLNDNKIGNQAAAEIVKNLPAACEVCGLIGNYVSEDIYDLLRGVKIHSKLVF